MASKIIQFRLPDDKVAFLESRGFDINAEAREALEGRIRQITFRESMKAISKIWVSPNFDPVKAVRESRDEH